MGRQACFNLAVDSRENIRRVSKEPGHTPFSQEINDKNVRPLMSMFLPKTNHQIGCPDYSQFTVKKIAKIVPEQLLVWEIRAPEGSEL